MADQVHHSRLTIVVTAVAVILGATLWWFLRSPNVVGGDEVSVQEIPSCSEELPWLRSPRVERVSRESSALVVRVLATDVCGGTAAEHPNALIEGNTITVSWQWVIPESGAITACLCTRRLEFRIPKARHISDPVIVVKEVAR